MNFWGARRSWYPPLAPRMLSRGCVRFSNSSRINSRNFSGSHEQRGLCQVFLDMRDAAARIGSDTDQSASHTSQHPRIEFWSRQTYHSICPKFAVNKRAKQSSRIYGTGSNVNEQLGPDLLRDRAITESSSTHTVGVT